MGGAETVAREVCSCTCWWMPRVRGEVVSAWLTLPFVLASASHPALGSANQHQINLKPHPGFFSGPIFHSHPGGWGCGLGMLTVFSSFLATFPVWFDESSTVHYPIINARCLLITFRNSAVT